MLSRIRTGDSQLREFSAVDDGPVLRRPRRRLPGSWLFPALVLVGLLGLTAAQVSGSSAAMLSRGEYNLQAAEAGPVLGAVQSVRSDEWIVNTPLTYGQVRTGFPRYSHSLAGGEDMSLIFDVPYLEWSTLFRPQNWAFFLLPFQFAFAFKWWLLASLLALSIYTWTLTVCPRRRLFAALLGMGAVLAPFIQWWYQTNTVAPVFYAFFLMTAFVRLVAARSRWALAGWTGLTAWLVGCFALVQYPPFQIPCALLAGGFCLGHLIDQVRRGGGRELAVRVGLVLLAGTAAAGVVAAFVLTRLPAIRTILDTGYPGRRTNASGGMSWARLITGYLDHQLLDADRAGALAGNQSEAAAFVVTGLFLAPVAAWLVVRSVRRTHRPPGALLVVWAVGLLLLAWCVLPGLEPLGAVTGLTQVPTGRLQLGIGVFAVMLTGLVIGELDRQDFVLPRVAAGAVGAVAFTAAAAVALQLRRAGSNFPPRLAVLVPLAALFAAAVYLAVRRRAVASAAILVALCGFGGLRVNPVQHRIPVAADMPIGRAVTAADHNDPGGWVSTDESLTPVLVETGVRTYSAVFGYPPLAIWRHLDPGGVYLGQYNRYAHVSFVTGSTAALFDTPAADILLVRLDGCGSFAQTSVRHVLAADLLPGPCLRLRSEVPLPARVLRIYDVVPPGT
jgi:hypothetical protein